MKLHLLPLLVALCCPPAALAADPITFDSLLKEMTDREAIARFPDPAYTCKQFSSYDRRSTTPDDPKTWFANGDVNQYLRTEEVQAGGTGVPPVIRKEWVMADMDGPGAIVRIWSANPAGTLRIYLDNQPQPVIEAPMNDLLGGKWKVGAPLSQECSKGWNLYLPIPYAKHCKITSDKDGFYYQVNYRTYDAAAKVATLSASDLSSASDSARTAGQELLKERELRNVRVEPEKGWKGIEPGGTQEISFNNMRKDSFVAGARPNKGAGVIRALHIQLLQPATAQDLRSVILEANFDGEQTIWAPLSDFFGAGVDSGTEFQDWYRRTTKDELACYWIMPFESEANLRLRNVGVNPVFAWGTARVYDWPWDARSMHFHANWHAEYPIHAYGARGTKDWNYIEAQGKGVYVGDTLAVMNPVPEWWGEGDEKIYVDGEKFPSHFGTGTEDYYGYAWCWPVTFQHPFHAQPRCDGNGKNNWGHTTVTRVRSLDAIPFTKSLKFDMEIWHWRECDEAYAATTYWYALPGATSNIKPDPETAAKPIPQPPPRPQPYKLAGAIECETMELAGKSEGTAAIAQDMEGFGRGKWSGESQLWIQCVKPGDFAELRFSVDHPGPQKVTLYATKSWDYGIVRFTINGKKAGEDTDFSSGQSGKCIPSGPIELGTFQPENGKLTLRAELVGLNPKTPNGKLFAGLDCIVVKPAN